MSGNTYGNIFKVTTFGESHGKALGCVIDGVPSGIQIDINKIQYDLNRRKPAQKDASGNVNKAITTRNENDVVEILSGVFDGVSTGCPICLLIKNCDQHSSDYSDICDKFRPGHADFTYEAKYGIRDYRGGGRSSGRETVSRVAAGAVAKMVFQAIAKKDYGDIRPEILAYTIEAAGIKANSFDKTQIEQNFMRCADKDAAEKMIKQIEVIRGSNDSCGAIVECKISGVPKGLGEPVFEKLDAELAKAMLSIGAVKAIEFGSGFECSRMLASQCNDKMMFQNGIKFLSNNAGGILGGISNGEEIIFRIAIKPVPSIAQKQKTVDKNGNECEIEIKGRHDVCLAPRIVPVVEAMSAIVLADFILEARSQKI